MQRSNHGELHCQLCAAPLRSDATSAFHCKCLVHRKQQYKDLSETMTKTDEKLSYQIGTIQSSISNMNTRLADLQDLVGASSLPSPPDRMPLLVRQNDRPEIVGLSRRLETIEHSHNEAEGNIHTMTNHLADMGTRQLDADSRLRHNEDKLKIEEQTVRDLAARMNTLSAGGVGGVGASVAAADDVASVRRDFNDKVCFLSFALRSLSPSCLCLSIRVLSSCLPIRFMSTCKNTFDNTKRASRKSFSSTSNVSITCVST